MVKGAFPYVFVVYLWFLVHDFVWWFVWMCMESYYEAWKVGYYHLTGNSGCGVTFFYSSRFLLILHWAVLSWLPFNSQVHHWVLYMTGSVLHNTWFHQDIASVYIQETSNKSPKNGGTRVLEPERVEKWLLLSVCCAMVDTRERSLSRETKHPDGWERSGVRLLSTLHYRLSSEN